MKERILKLISDPKKFPIMVGVVSFGAGATIGYFAGKKNRKQPYIIPPMASHIDREDLDNYLKEEVKVDNDIVISSQEVLPDDKVVSGATFVEEKIKTVSAPPVTPESVEVVSQTIFADNDDDWDYAKELQNRTPDQPYIIHKDEFYADEMEFTQSTLTYYAGDNILTDEEDVPIYNHDDVIGPMQFGHGSKGDPNVFHVRNEKRKAEYEIIRDAGLYSVEVLGLEIEDNQRARNIKHSSRNFED
jgi:hypothetical protein